MRGNPFLLLFIMIVSIFVFELSLLSANSTVQIMINEVLPDASGSDSGKEWIELFNYSNTQIVLNGYYLKVESNSGSTKTINIPQIILPANSYSIISEFDFPNANYLNIGSGKLGMYNSASKITLFDSSNNKLDELSYPTPSENMTYERRGATCVDVSMNNSGGSGGVANNNYDAACFPSIEEIPVSAPLPPEPQQPKIYELQITEIYPSPSSEEEEWLEIFNYGKEDIDLKNFTLQKPSTSTKTILQGSLKSNAYRLIAGTELKFALNNSGDEIMLVSKENFKVDTLKYKNTPKGFSVGKTFANDKYITNGEFAENTMTPSPLEKNIFPDTTIYQIGLIRDLNNQSLGKRYTFSGYVTVDTAKTKNNTIYISDESSTIKIINSSNSEFFAGNKVRVEGKLSKLNSEIYIENAAIEYLNENSAIEYKALVSKDQIENLLLTNVTFSGEVVSSYSTSFDINFAGVIMRINKIEDIKISKGTAYTVKGFLYKDVEITRVIAADIQPQNGVVDLTAVIKDESIPVIVENEQQYEQSTLDTKIKYLGNRGQILGDSSTLNSIASLKTILPIVQFSMASILILSFVDIKYVNLWKTKLKYWLRNIKLQSLKDYF